MVVLICLAILAGGTQVSMAAAKTGKDKRAHAGKAVVNDGLAVSAGLFFPTGSDAGDVLGNGIGINAEKMISVKDRYDVYGSLGFVRFSNSWEGADVSEHIIPVMVTVMPRQSSKNRAAKFYYGAGLGLTFTKLDYSSDWLGGSDSKLDFAWQFVGGTKFGDKMFAEAKYLSGGREANTGFSLNVGSRF